MTPDAPRRAHWTLALGIALAVLLAGRLFHLVGPLDDPHSWRQCDTVEATRVFFRHGIDLLHPQVSWLGGHGTLIFELPLPEAAAALLDRAFGFTPTWDRVVTLASFILALVFLYRLVRALAGDRVAAWAALLYAVFPLGQFFSRAPTVDFPAAACAHGFLWFGWRAARGGGWRAAAWAALCGALTAGIKGPYLLPVGAALLPIAFASDRAGRVRCGAAVAASAVAFFVWRSWVNGVNAAAPDWTWLPGYYKEVNPWWWYVGTLSQRAHPAAWLTLARRFTLEIATPAGVPLVLAGLVVPPPGASAPPSARTVAWAWLAGTVAYVLVFFPLNVIHDYYQVPILAPAALLAALGFEWLVRHPLAIVRVAAAGLALAVAAGAAWLPHKLHYYRVDELRETAGAAIAARVPPGDLVVAVDHSSEYSDPRLLHRADHHGWALRATDVTPERLALLRAAGARWVAWVSEPGNASLVPPSFLGPYQVAEAPLAAHGHALGTLYLYTLGSMPGGSR